jgi:predicted nucleic acid-binding protein
VSYLLDTNVVSELTKPQPTADVLTWLAQAGDTFVSVMTIGELRIGIERKRRRDSAEAAMLDLWLEGTVAEFDSRIVPIDRAIAEEWGRLDAAGSVPFVVGLIAATALVHGWIVATRNVRDFDRMSVSTYNPFGN